MRITTLACVSALALLTVPISVHAQIEPTGSVVAADEAAEPTGGRFRRPVAAAVLDATADLGEIQIDGVFDEPDWDQARLFNGFTQREPVEGVPAEYDTEVRVLFGEGAIWIAARMWDPEPESIDKRLGRRDAHGTFDQFSVQLDPNLDGLTGYSFRVSAAGVQGDTYFYDDDKMDQAWDAVWSSAVKIDHQGWTAEIRIPLSQIRYQASDDVQTWGINFHRMRVANNERSYYALLTQTRRGIVSQMGRIENIVVSRPSRRLEVLPYAVSSLHQGPSVSGDPFFDGTAAGGRVGMDVSYGLGAAFTLDATINPDFGQVEADPAVINLTAFETFFPEQRPFFVEDARTLDFTLAGRQNNLFYSRRIGRAPHGRAPSDASFADVPENATILGAAKLSGRTTSGLSIGALAAVTGNEHGEGLFSSGSTSEFLVEPRSGYGVLSLAKDFNGGITQIRGTSTVVRRDLPGDGSFDWLADRAYTGGLRLDHQWADRTWSVYGFFTGSYVGGSPDAIERVQRSSIHYLQRPDATRYAVDPTRTSVVGRDWRVQVDKSGGEHWTGGVWVGETTELYEINDLGYSTTPERLDTGFRIGYREIQPGEHLRGYNLSLMSYHNFSHEAFDDTWSVHSWHNARVAGSNTLNANVQLLNYWDLKTSLTYTPQQMSRRATRGGPMMIAPATRKATFDVSSDRRQAVSFGAHYEIEDDLLGYGGGQMVRGDVRFQPSDNVAVSLNPRFQTRRSGDQYVTATSTLPYAPTYDVRYLFADLDQKTFSMEARLDWTFTPTLSLQLFAQPLLSSGDYVQYKQLAQSQTFDFDELTPGTGQELPTEVQCSSEICEIDNTQHVDFDADGTADYSFRDRDFNVRSLIGNVVLRWEYRPGSTIYLVWQRRQADEALVGNFDFGRDAGALFGAPADNRFIVKMNYWLGL